MKNHKFINQSGSATMWIVLVGIVVLAGVGYFVYSSTSKTGYQAPVSVTTPPNDSNPANVAPVNTTPSQNSNCDSYITASDIASALGLSSETTITAKTSGNNGGCVISWKDPSINPIVKQSPNSTGIINMINTGSTQTAITGTTLLCKSKPSLGIGDVSCAGPMTANPDGGIVFAKNGFTVSIVKVSLANKTGGLATIARTVAGNI